MPSVALLAYPVLLPFFFLSRAQPVKGLGPDPTVQPDPWPLSGDPGQAQGNTMGGIERLIVSRVYVAEYRVRVCFSTGIFWVVPTPLIKRQARAFTR